MPPSTERSAEFGWHRGGNGEHPPNGSLQVNLRVCGMENISGGCQWGAGGPWGGWRSVEIGRASCRERV